MLAIFSKIGIIERMTKQNTAQQKTYTLVLTSAELELIYDQLNIVELYDDSEENLELCNSINDKVFKAKENE